MALEVTSDVFEEVSVTEHAGEIVEARTVRWVKNVTTSPIMFTALDDDSVPKVGDELNAERAPNVKLVSRTATGRTKQSDGSFLVRIELLYQLQRKDARPVRGGTTLSQIRTMNYPSGEQIIVTHEGDPQTGEVTVMAPESNVVLPLTRSVKDPDAFADKFVGHVNGAPWRGAVAGQWLCTRWDWELSKTTTDPSQDPPPAATSTDSYDFEFEFQESSDKVDGWSVSAAYRDAKGKIPTDVTRSPQLGDNYPIAGESITFGVITWLHYPKRLFGPDFSYTPSGEV